ncbi:LPS-assembly protein LptD [Cognatishimia sp.]|uniref:LPS-assembly protein LptD n=1 Tax=Cognatishimia sp. TaxID=2211648 RepID=UPI00351168CA
MMLAATCSSFALATPTSAAPGDSVVLLADSVFLQGNSILTATGNVEAISGDAILTATKIVYNSVTDTITITGPISVTDGGVVEIFADFAELDSALQNGLLSSARLVLDQQVELQADSIKRIDGNLSELNTVQVTSCKTCEDGETPLWYIRAKKVTHNEADKELLLEEAQLRVLDIPVFYLPRMRLPDPTQERATGFLIPSVEQRSRIGLATKIPYFIAIGDHRDLTLTPYFSRNMTTIEGRYRQAFTTGDIMLSGAATQDNFSGFGSRGYLFAEGAFALKRDYTLSFDAKFTSDQAYLLDYDYSSLDRLNSELALTRASRDENTRFAFNHFRTLRATEDNETIPTFVLSAQTQNRIHPSFGGEVLWELEVHAHARESQVATDANSDGIVDGRDVTRINGEVGWRDNWWTDAGFNIGVQGHVAVDAVKTDQDATITHSDYTQITPSAAATLRYPLQRSTAQGAQQILEPVVQLGWSGGSFRDGAVNDAIANDESSRSEFDEGNLLSLSRFASDDRRERGVSLAYGLNLAHFGETWNAGLSFGHILYEKANDSFTVTSGLEGRASDLLVAGQMSHDNGLMVTGRLLLDEQVSLTKAEASGGWHNERLGLNASYVWLGQDAEENRPDTLAEWTLDSSYRMTRHWTGLANWRFDVAGNRTTEAGFGLEYRNECVKAQLAVGRRFTSSTSVQPVTDLSFTVELLGFSAKTRDKSYSRSCETTGF